MKLRLAMIFVKGLPRMASFYGGALGLVPIAETRTASWVEFDSGTVNVALHAIPAHIADHIEILSPPQAREESPIKLVFVVDNVESEYARLAALGVPMELRPWGVAEGFDPEGNVFQISGPLGG